MNYKLQGFDYFDRGERERGISTAYCCADASTAAVRMENSITDRFSCIPAENVYYDGSKLSDVLRRLIDCGNSAQSAGKALKKMSDALFAIGKSRLRRDDLKTLTGRFDGAY